MALRSTHTFAELELSQTAYDEIAGKLKAAGYDHAFMASGTIDMHGIGVTRCPVPDHLTPHADTPELSKGGVAMAEVNTYRGPF